MDSKRDLSLGPDDQIKHISNKIAFYWLVMKGSNTHQFICVIQYLSIYIKMGVQMFVCLFVCLSVGMWRANGNPNPAPILMKFCTHIPTCPRKVLMQV